MATKRKRSGLLLPPPPVPTELRERPPDRRRSRQHHVAMGERGSTQADDIAGAIGGWVSWSIETRRRRRRRHEKSVRQPEGRRSATTGTIAGHWQDGTNQETDLRGSKWIDAKRKAEDRLFEK
jgi:hypothetical protein